MVDYGINLEKRKIGRHIVNIFLTIREKVCYVCSKEPSR